MLPISRSRKRRVAQLTRLTQLIRLTFAWVAAVTPQPTCPARGLICVNPKKLGVMGCTLSNPMRQHVNTRPTFCATLFSLLSYSLQRTPTDEA
jgi:hypothetical protein